MSSKGDLEALPTKEDEILAALSDDAIGMLGKFPGIWDAASLFPSIAELQKLGLIEETPLTSTGRLTRVHTELGKKVLERVKSNEEPKDVEVILASLGDEARARLREFSNPGFLGNAEDHGSTIDELKNARLIEDTTMPYTGRPTWIHTELGTNVLGFMQLKDNPESEIPVADVMWRKERKKRESLEETLGRVAYLLEEVGLAWDEVREELTARDEGNIEEAIDSHRRENE